MLEVNATSKSSPVFSNRLASSFVCFVFSSVTPSGAASVSLTGYSVFTWKLPLGEMEILATARSLAFAEGLLMVRS